MKIKDFYCKHNENIKLLAINLILVILAGFGRITGRMISEITPTPYINYAYYVAYAAMGGIAWLIVLKIFNEFETEFGEILKGGGAFAVILFMDIVVLAIMNVAYNFISWIIIVTALNLLLLSADYLIREIRNPSETLV